MAPDILITALALAQSVEQIPQPTKPAVAVQADQAHGPAGDRTSIAQLPPEPRAVAQPLPDDRPKVAGDAAVDAARAYVAILGSGPTPTELGPRTVAEAAAAASLSANAPTPSTTSHVPPKP